MCGSSRLGILCNSTTWFSLCGLWASQMNHRQQLYWLIQWDDVAFFVEMAKHLKWRPSSNMFCHVWDSSQVSGIRFPWVDWERSFISLGLLFPLFSKKKHVQTWPSMQENGTHTIYRTIFLSKEKAFQADGIRLQLLVRVSFSWMVTQVESHVEGMVPKTWLANDVATLTLVIPLSRKEHFNLPMMRTRVCHPFPYYLGLYPISKDILLGRQ